MIFYTDDQLAAVIALPIVTILLVWTIAIYHRNRKQWAPYDIPVLSILILSTLRNLATLSYILFVTLHRGVEPETDFCGGVIWTFNSIHTFQASILTTLAIIGLFSQKLRKKNQTLRQFLTATHVVYHLFCLTTLCACVGVAAILARGHHAVTHHITDSAIFDTNPCTFMPFDLDVKFNVFIIVLHVFLATVSMVSFVVVCIRHFRVNNQKRQNFDYLNKSNSDLSNLSLDLVAGDGNKNCYYDTYLIHNNNNQRHAHHHACCDTHAPQHHVAWNSDVSNISATVSSTNSRRPCIAPARKICTGNATSLGDLGRHGNTSGLETIHPLLIVCYLFYHLPIIVLCVYPKLVRPWSVSGVALWLGLVQDILIPVGLCIVDTRFCKWVSNVYKCTDQQEEKLPHGLDGKFRPFCSQPQSLDTQNRHAQQQTIEHRFPITNGSLYTSIDGRVPVIHNYRRHKDQNQGGKVVTNPHLLNRQTYFDHPQLSQMSQLSKMTCGGCQTDMCASHSNLHHLSPQYLNKQLNILQTGGSSGQDIPRYTCANVKNENFFSVIPPKHSQLNRTTSGGSNDTTSNLQRLTRLSKSDVSLERGVFSSQKRHSILDYSSSDDDIFGLTTPGGDLNLARNLDSLSSRSEYSITTEANCDFDFYQNDQLKIPQHTKKKQNGDIFKTTINLDGGHFDDTFKNDNFRMMHRSNSYMTLEDRRKLRNGAKKLLRSDSKMSDCTHNIRDKIKSVEYLPQSNASTVFIEDVFYFNYPSQQNNQNRLGSGRCHVGSVPDLKKIFISEYI